MMSWPRLLGMAVAALAVAALVGLGLWQLQRLAWKTDLIARVEARMSAPPTPAPGPDAWARLSADASEYTRVTLHGHYLTDHPDLLAQALTERGAGYWVMSAFETDGGWRLWINRGFVPQDARAKRDWAAPVPDATGVQGLLRLSQKGGGFLRENDAAGGRWYSRDVAAMAAASGIGPVAPYFVDAAAGPDPAARPMGGMTLVQFPNNHLVYALTWFAMAFGLICGLIVVARRKL